MHEIEKAFGAFIDVIEADERNGAQRFAQRRKIVFRHPLAQFDQFMREVKGMADERLDGFDSRGGGFAFEPNHAAMRNAALHRHAHDAADGNRDAHFLGNKILVGLPQGQIQRHARIFSSGVVHAGSVQIQNSKFENSKSISTIQF